MQDSIIDTCTTHNMQQLKQTKRVLHTSSKQVAPEGATMAAAGHGTAAQANPAELS